MLNSSDIDRPACVSGAAEKNFLVSSASSKIGDEDEARETMRQVSSLCGRGYLFSLPLLSTVAYVRYRQDLTIILFSLYSGRRFCGVVKLNEPDKPSNAGRALPKLRASQDRVDICMGKRLKAKRILAGLSQAEVGKILGVTFQQVQKYETGVNRLPISRLYRLAEALDTPLTYFLGRQELGVTMDNLSDRDGAAGKSAVKTSSDRSHDLYDKEALELVRAFLKISSAEQRRKVLGLIKAMTATRHE